MPTTSASVDVSVVAQCRRATLMIDGRSSDDDEAGCDDLSGVSSSWTILLQHNMQCTSLLHFSSKKRSKTPKMFVFNPKCSNFGEGSKFSYICRVPEQDDILTFFKIIVKKSDAPEKIAMHLKR
uniref:Uncharacterized protein n=1 Tax=Romanomermis culicivorax TaxID=13658 RepID=A0A915ISX6_ROMCU